MIDLQKYYYEQYSWLIINVYVKVNIYILPLEKFVFKGKVAVFSLMEFPAEVGTLSGQPIEGKSGDRVFIRTLD